DRRSLLEAISLETEGLLGRDHLRASGGEAPVRCDQLHVRPRDLALDIAPDAIDLDVLLLDRERAPAGSGHVPDASGSETDAGVHHEVLRVGERPERGAEEARPARVAEGAVGAVELPVGPRPAGAPLAERREIGGARDRRVATDGAWREV